MRTMRSMPARPRGGIEWWERTGRSALERARGAPGRARAVEGDRFANQRLEGGRVDVFSLVDVDRPARVSLEARVEQTGRILQGGALGEGELHDLRVGLAGADDAVVGPDRRAGLGRFDPLPFLDDVGIGFLDQLAHYAEGLAAPVPELGDPSRDQVRRRPALARARVFHVRILARRQAIAGVGCT